MASSLVLKGPNNSLYTLSCCTTLDIKPLLMAILAFASSANFLLENLSQYKEIFPCSVFS